MKEFPYHRENRLARSLLRHKTWRRIIPALGWRYILATVDSLEMILDIADQEGVSKYILRYGDYAPTVTRLMRERLSSGGAFLDIGANIGYHSLLAATLTPDPVYAFEPEPGNFELLLANLARAGADHVVPLRKACGDRPGTLELYLSPTNAGDHQAYAGDGDRESISIESVRVDDELPGIENLVFIKMDVQGFEAHVVRGMEQTLARHPGAVMVSEFWPAGLRRAGLGPDAYLDFLEERGYRWQVIEDREGRLHSQSRQEIYDRCGERGFVDLFFER